MSARLRRRGSTGVFLGRITPGLRVVTTYVCGLVRMPRRTFVAGLAPGVAVYQGVFIGLGAWLGPTAWVTIERYAPKPGQLVLLFAVIGGSMIAGHALVNRIRGPKLA